ncbi:MAG TPA: hypothetical protein VH276_10940 [Solirubrobacteraceae bacterium]|jgi:hypothetical protein|nr:hypothetical protein [Solirubrobacteraceae bacterium]
MPAAPPIEPQPSESRPPEPPAPIERHHFATPVVHEVVPAPSVAMLDCSTW